MKESEPVVPSATTRPKHTTTPASRRSHPVRLWQKIKRHSRPLGRHAAQFITHSSLPEIFFISSFLIARYLPNSDFSYPSEIILPIVLFGVLASGIFYFFKWTFRLVFSRTYSSLPAHIATFLLTYALYGFNYAFPTFQKWTDAVLPSSLTTAFSSAITRILLMGVIFWAIAAAITWFIKRIRVLRNLQPLKILVFIACFVFAWQGVKLAERLWTVRHQLAYEYSAQLPAKPNRPNSSGSQSATSSAANDAIQSETTATQSDITPLPAKPNVYYLLFDRYASNDTLKNIYDYDNTGFLDYLDNEGFVTRQPAYANYPFTTQSVASTLSMGYLKDLGEQFRSDAGGFQTNFPYRSIIDNAPAAQVFRQNGYHYNEISSWWDVTRDGIKADSQPAKSFHLHVLGLDFWLTDLQRDIVYRSALQPLLEKGITIGHTPIIKYDEDRNPSQNFSDEMQALKSIAQSSGKQAQPQFTFAHVLSPHDPYIFDEDGSPAPYNGDRTDQDVDEYTKYVNQLKYITTRIEDLISTIRANDPTAVVIFQPDEGPYPKDFRGSLSPGHYFDPKNLDDESLHQKVSITASYYMPGLDADVIYQELTGNVNVFPFVLNHYLGYNIPYLPECNFSAGNKFVLYDFSLLTGRLNGTADPEVCKQYLN